ncbi:MAG: hypothetical protein U5L72_03280 [Bacteroidales bacterium]|nr:hypothetical protein [Bacteroidales bacterium]
MLVRKDDSYAVIDLPSAPVEMKEKFNLSNMKVWVDLSAEWNQIYNESCEKQIRNFFYAPNMHGTDWTTKLPGIRVQPFCLTSDTVMI